MCGISGIISTTASADLLPRLKRMNDCLGHRGPDDEGFVWLGTSNQLCAASGVSSPLEIKQKLPLITSALASPTRLGLAHRRFSIIDVSAAGHQPWIDEQAGMALVFNGEIYNYLELRQDLAALGIRDFKSDSDTEVLLKAFQVWGTNCFERFNGFWALAILDLRKGSLVLSRDRFGKKPLYLFRQAERIFFSSEVRSIGAGIDGGLASLSVNTGHAFAYLLYDRRNVLHGSMWNEIELLPAASFACFDLATQREDRRVYWELPVNRRNESEISLPAAREEFQNIFSQAVRLRLRSDVPYCADLSGGMDSSAIVATAQQILGRDHPLRTNYISYPDAPELDESAYAQSVAKFSGCQHETLELGAQQAWNYFDQLVEAFEEPVHSQAYMTQWLGWKKVKDSGMKVILHGAAGDELLAGYPYLTQLADLENINSGRWLQYFADKSALDYKSWARPLRWLAQGRLWPNLSNQVRGMLGLPNRRKHMQEYLPDLQLRYFNADFLTRNLELQDKFDQLFLTANKSLASRMWWDFKALRIPFWVNAMDKSMMSLPVEVRMPFLDHKLVDFAFTLPIGYLYRSGWSKFILRESMRGKIPENVLWRKTKMGFTVPKQRWLSANKEKIREIVNDAREKLSYFVMPEPFLNSTEHVPSDYLWRTLNFARWLSIFNPRVV